MKFIEIPYPLQDLEVTVTCGNIQLLPRHGYHGYTFPHAYSSRHLLPIAAGAGRASAGLTCNKVMPRDPCGAT